MRMTIGAVSLAFLLAHPAFGAEPDALRKPLEPMSRGTAANAAAHMAEEDRLDRLDAANKRLLNASRAHSIEFKEDSYDLNPGQDRDFKYLANAVIDAVRTLNQDFPKLDIVVEAHTENSGRAGHETELSQRRAERVCANLVPYTSMRCNGIGYGSTKPLVSPEDTPAKRAKNRRIVVQVAPR